MAITLQLRRGTEKENNEFTGAVGELSYDTTNNLIRIHDGVKKGGTIISNYVSPEELTSVDYRGFLLQEICFDVPFKNDGLIPLNDPGQTTGVLVTSADLKYPTLWAKLLAFKARGQAVTDPTDKTDPDYAYTKFNKTQEEYDECLENTRILANDGTTVLKSGFCSYFVIDEENKTVRFPFKGDSFTRGWNDTSEFDTTDQIRNITGSIYTIKRSASNPNSSGSLYYGSSGSGGAYGTSSSGHSCTISFDASRVVPVGDENQPRAQGKFYYIIVDSAIPPNDNTEDKIDYVIDWQAPTAENNHTWYRKYKSGWVEQGGLLDVQTIASGESASQIVVLPIAMQDTNYNFTPGAVVGSWMACRCERGTTQATFFQYNRAASGSGKIQHTWRIEGFAA